jgi:LuxR family quorum sensing-dependent transcriptional regulator
MTGTRYKRSLASQDEKLRPAIPGVADAAYDPAFGWKLLNYAVEIEKYDTGYDVLDRLHAIASHYCRLNVLGAALFPLTWGDWTGVEKGKTVFLHESAPEGWWEHYLELGRKNLHPGLMMAKYSLASTTWTESRRVLEPLGIDRWPYELALKYGMRDGLICPIGGKWVVVYWSRKVLTNILTPHVRVLLFMGANFAAIRLQQLVDPYVGRVGTRASLTPRELAVLRSFSIGNRTKETADHLDLGVETIRTHLKHAEAKLGVHDRAHAVAQALRLHLIS